MDHVVAKIAEDQTRERGRRQPPKYPKKNSVEAQRERDADDRRHHEPFRILRIIMMDAVQQEVELLPPPAGGLIMEHPPVHHVFHQGPEEEAEDE